MPRAKKTAAPAAEVGQAPAATPKPSRLLQIPPIAPHSQGAAEAAAALVAAYGPAASIRALYAATLAHIAKHGSTAIPDIGEHPRARILAAIADQGGQPS